MTTEKKSLVLSADGSIATGMAIATATVNPQLKMDEVSKQAGKFIIDSLVMDQKCKTVSEIWVENGCIGWDVFANILQKNYEANKDVLLPIDALSIVANDMGLPALAVDHDTLGGVYSFSGGQFGSYNELGKKTELGARLSQLGHDKESKEMIVALYAHDWKTTFKTEWLKQKDGENKKVFLRLRDNGKGKTVRAMLSQQYLPIDHRFVADTLFRATGGQSYVSHFQEDKFLAGGGDYLAFNCLFHDGIIKDDNRGDYGAMSTNTNSEVGNGRITMLPSIFAAICMNGQIWGNVKDNRFRVSKVHKGNAVNYAELQAEMIEKINQAVPLSIDHVSTLLDLQKIKSEPMEVIRTLGYVGKNELELTRDQRYDLYNAHIAEENKTDSAMDLVNAITRFAHEHVGNTLRQQVGFEMAGGQYLESFNADKGNWSQLVKNASKFDVAKDIAAVSA